jgi:hypothetical protein
MDLHPRDTAALERTLAELASVHEGRVLAVALYGEAAGGDYRPRKSPLNLAIVLDTVTPQRLAPMRQYLRRWRRRRIETPLVLDPPYLETSFDVFPLEFIDIMDRHQLLAGRTDPFAEPDIDIENLRFEVEEQLRGKMLHLWEGYLEASNPRALATFLKATPAAFGPILRGLLYLVDEPRPAESDQLVSCVERSLEMKLEHFHRIDRVRTAHEALPTKEVEHFFEGYLKEVRSLVQRIDRL